MAFDDPVKGGGVDLMLHQIQTFLKTVYPDFDDVDATSIVIGNARRLDMVINKEISENDVVEIAIGDLLCSIAMLAQIRGIYLREAIEKAHALRLHVWKESQ